jgi:hypothetical protein
MHDLEAHDDLHGNKAANVLQHPNAILESFGCCSNTRTNWHEC